MAGGEGSAERRGGGRGEVERRDRALTVRSVAIPPRRASLFAAIMWREAVGVADRVGECLPWSDGW